MNYDFDSLPDNSSALKKIIADLSSSLDQKNEEIRLLRQALFGPKSERQSPGKYPQLPLFDMPENPPEEEEEAVTVFEHTRRKKGRKKLPENLPRVDVIHDIPEEEKICACGCRLRRIGEEVSEKLDIIPARIQVIRNIRPQYACRNCEGVEDDGSSVKRADAPPQIIPKGLATAGLLAYVVIAKFCDALPFYRQEKQFLRLGIEISRSTMCSWAMKAAQSCQGILDLLHNEIRGGPLINIDETTVQVLDEPGRSATQKSYMWVFRGGSPGNPVVIYQYHQTRSGDVAKLFLDDFAGVVQTDGYKGYDFLDNRLDILHVGCWAHARRKFVDVKKAGSGNKTGSADQALAMIKRLYALEKTARQKKMPVEQKYEIRQQQAKPILQKFKNWLDKRQGQVPPKSLLGKAINYCQAQWHRLENYIQDGNAAIDNNMVENAIRPFTLGRKNWLFSGTPAGARASALLYSLIETAKANNLEPYRYLRFLFEKLPSASAEDLHHLLPTKLEPADIILPDQATGV